MIQCADRPFRSPQTPQSKMMELQSKGYYTFFPNENWTPNVNLYETDGAYLVCVDLAGVEKEKIDIEVIEGRLRLRGKRAVPMCIENAEAPHARVRMHLMEIDHGAFSREVELPDDVHRERISARYQDGLLWIDLPKKN
ncbi:MAG: Hsp20/alpha crystallin family protein [Tepidisphaeraceae bacterium]